MTPQEYEVFDAAVRGSRTAEWFEHPDRITTTRDLIARGLIAKVDLHRHETGAEPQYYRGTEKGNAFAKRATTWDDARTMDLPPRD